LHTGRSISDFSHFEFNAIAIAIPYPAREQTDERTNERTNGKITETLSFLFLLYPFAYEAAARIGKGTAFLFGDIGVLLFF
jgi:hypothetical protein